MGKSLHPGLTQYLTYTKEAYEEANKMKETATCHCTVESILAAFGLSHLDTCAEAAEQRSDGVEQVA